MSYRPITDLWFLARAKLKGGRKYYGAYLGGFPERARVLLGASINDPVLHVCGGMARYYPYAGGFGPHDRTLDLDPATEPDFLQDATAPLPPRISRIVTEFTAPFRAMLADPPYSEADAAHYVPGAAKYPAPSKIVQNMIDALPVGGRAGIIHYIVPRCPPNAKFIACVGVVCGFNNRMRAFSVFERKA
jgi:hypothetical protein